MNRKNEFEAMIEELNQPAPGLEATLDRAYKRKRKRTTLMIVRPLAGLAACFAVFVLLVNFCAPVAYACSLVPGLRELAAAVTFSRSLTDAVENEYVQPMDLSQTQNDITATITSNDVVGVNNILVSVSGGWSDDGVRDAENATSNRTVSYQGIAYNGTTSNSGSASNVGTSFYIAPHDFIGFTFTLTTTAKITATGHTLTLFATTDS